MHVFKWMERGRVNVNTCENSKTVKVQEQCNQLIVLRTRYNWYYYYWGKVRLGNTLVVSSSLVFSAVGTVTLWGQGRSLRNSSIPMVLHYRNLYTVYNVLFLLPCGVINTAEIKQQWYLKRCDLWITLSLSH